MAKLEVTSETITEFIAVNATSDNYPLLQGLHLLDKDRFLTIFSALINSEIFVENLFQMGTYSDLEVDRFIREYIGRMDYEYLSTANPPALLDKTLGAYVLFDLKLSEVLNAYNAVRRREPQQFKSILGVAFNYGPSEFYKTRADLDTSFNTDVLRQFTTAEIAMYPARTESAIATLPLGVALTPEQRVLFRTLYIAIYTPLFYAGLPTLDILFSVGLTKSLMFENINLAALILRSEFPSQNTLFFINSLILSSRTAQVFTAADINKFTNDIYAVSFGVPGMITNNVNKALILIKLVQNWYTLTGGTVPARFTDIAKAYEAVVTYNTQFRTFIQKVYTVSLKKMIGSFKPSDGQQIGI